MRYDREKRGRRSIRLDGYDYSLAGAYFVTVCTRDRECLFGEIVGSSMHLSSLGRVVRDCWEDLTRHYPELTLDTFVVMPNHIHGILVLRDSPSGVASAEAGADTRQPHALTDIVRALKAFSSRSINDLRGTPGRPLWQRNYYEHVVRDEGDLANLREYIVENPLKWALDTENPDNPAGDGPPGRGPLE